MPISLRYSTRLDGFLWSLRRPAKYEDFLAERTLTTWGFRDRTDGPWVPPGFLVALRHMGADLRAADAVTLARAKGFESSLRDAEAERRNDTPYAKCLRPLKPFQHQAVNWLYLRGGGVDADSVGLGKTATALGLLQRLWQEAGQDWTEGRPALVVCQAAQKYGWLREIGEVLGPRVAARAVVVDGDERARQRCWLAAEDAPVQHPRQVEVRAVAGAPRDPVQRVPLGDTLANVLVTTVGRR
ncbi:MAG: hypothetical protein Q8R28_20570, partial [Dehalococcoidia bacterium]|nr:hypothetical protein [Dehalococcoidia bacterium]